jgi:hypothetical protein
MVASSRSSSAGSSPPDPYADAWERVAGSILGAPGALTPAVRRAIAEGGGPDELAPLLEKVRLHAYKVVDRDFGSLSDDAAMEAVLAAALGAADERRRAALEAIG